MEIQAKSDFSEPEQPRYLRGKMGVTGVEESPLVSRSDLSRGWLEDCPCPIGGYFSHHWDSDTGDDNSKEEAFLLPSCREFSPRLLAS